MIRLLTYFSILFIVAPMAMAAPKADGNTPTYRFTGDAELLTHFVDRGLSITNNNPALTASFLFNMGTQFRIGFWGSNISNITSPDDNLWLKGIADVQIDFRKDTVFRLYFNYDQYYKSDLRNGQELGVTYEFRSYQTQFEWMTNYQGSRTQALYFKVGKIYPLWRGFVPGASIGYTVQRAEGYLNYFDIRGFMSYTVTSTFEFEGAISAVSNSTQFSGRGDPAAYVGIKLNY